MGDVTAELSDDGRRYYLTVPRGYNDMLDWLQPGSESPSIAVYGTADLNQRLAEAERLGVQVSHRDVTDEWAAEA